MAAVWLMTVIRSRLGWREGGRGPIWPKMMPFLSGCSPWLLVTQHLSQSHNFPQNKSAASHNITIFQNLNTWTFRDWHLSSSQSAQPLLLPKLHRCLPGSPALHCGYQGCALRYQIVFVIMSLCQTGPTFTGRENVCEKIRVSESDVQYLMS